MMTYELCGCACTFAALDSLVIGIDGLSKAERLRESAYHEYG